MGAANRWDPGSTDAWPKLLLVLGFATIFLGVAVAYRGQLFGGLVEPDVALVLIPLGLLIVVAGVASVLTGLMDWR